jgi:nucleoside-diphosphate-sugar epimerase
MPRSPAGYADGLALTRVAILGASGFVGNRVVEMLHKGGHFDVVPLVRRAAGLALSARLGLTGVVADALRDDMLIEGLRGCDAVISCVAGPPATITGMCRPLVRAAAAAGVARIVHLSSQMVHGQSLAPGTTEDSPISSRQPFRYNRAKAEAERILGSLASSAGLELIILRPGIVYGPRSRWTGGIADELLAGEAFLVDDADRVCNAVYVDNLVHAIELALEPSAPTATAFFINDAGRMSWDDLVMPVADALALADAIRRPTVVEALEHSISPRRERLVEFARAGARRLPRPLAEALRAARAAGRGGGRDEPVPPGFSREMTLLQTNRVHLSSDKARRLLGYRPPFACEEAMQRSISWLRFAGYPVQ